MQYHLGLCSAPCVGLIQPQPYKARVDDFIGFLAGESSATVEGLIAKRDAYADNLQFEKAAALQEKLDLLGHLQLRSYRLIRAIEEHNAIIVLPDTRPGSSRLLGVLWGQPERWLSFSPQQDSWRELENLVDDLLARMRDGANVVSTHQRSIDKAWFEEARLVSQWLEAQAQEPDEADAPESALENGIEENTADKPKSDGGRVVFLNRKDRAQILNELWRAFTEDASRSRISCPRLWMPSATAAMKPGNGSRRSMPLIERKRSNLNGSGYPH